MKLQQYWDISQAADLDAFKRGLGTMAANMDSSCLARFQ
jgi:hypothetical protein